MSTVDVIRAAAPGFEPAVAIVLGSGLGGLADRVEDRIELPYSQLPGFPETTVSGHSGALILGRLGGLPVALLRGRGHYYETGNAAAMRGAIATLSELGVTRLVLTNAAGSTQEETGPGMAMLITDHIDWSGRNPLIGNAEDDRRFVNLVDAYDPKLRAIMADVAAERGIKLAKGIYMWFSGPAFETPAEIRAAKMLGADAVGMSTVPEVILARYYGLRVMALSLITNLAAGLSDEALSHEHTKEMAALGAENFERLVIGFLEHLAAGDDA